MVDLTQITAAHEALFARLKADPAFAQAEGKFNELLPHEPPTKPWLNVVMAPGRAQVLDEVLGLGEDDVVVEYAQIFHIEWVVSRPDDAKRKAAFEQGLRDIQRILHADRTLGGVARGLTIGPGDREGHRYALFSATSAANIPVRVLLAGASPIG